MVAIKHFECVAASLSLISSDKNNVSISTYLSAFYFAGLHSNFEQGRLIWPRL
jgi:hypothetical protein